MLDQLLNKTRFAQFPFLPSYWLSSSILQWAEGVLSAAGFFILVLLSHVSFFGYLAFTRLGDSFYETASAVQSRASLLGEWGWFRSVADRRQRMAHRPSLMERLFGVIPWLAPDAKALVVKDIRTFWRDTTQWGQSVVLFGLLGVYVLNLRHFTHTLANPFWVTLVAYLNLGACSLNLATVTTRFVYPQFSLEGRRLWIVGMAPMGLARVVKTKYWMATICSLSVTMLLVTLSSYMLKMSWGRIGYFAVVTCVMTFSLNGLAVGLGMLYPNFKDGNPSKIVSGLGGTLCLILSFLYILVSVLALGFGTGGVHPRPEWVVSSIFVFAALSFLVGWMPLKLGFRQLNRIEI
jgi:ABC-2 type transport system permease protein